MKTLGVILLLLCLCLMVFSLVLGSFGRHVVDAWSLQAQQPDSVADTVMF